MPARKVARIFSARGKPKLNAASYFYKRARSLVYLTGVTHGCFLLSSILLVVTLCSCLILFFWPAREVFLRFTLARTRGHAWLSVTDGPHSFLCSFNESFFQLFFHTRSLKSICHGTNHSDRATLIKKLESGTVTMLELLFIFIKFTFLFTIIYIASFKNEISIAYLDREIEQNFRFTKSRSTWLASTKIWKSWLTFYLHRDNRLKWNSAAHLFRVWLKLILHCEDR